MANEQNTQGQPQSQPQQQQQQQQQPAAAPQNQQGGTAQSEQRETPRGAPDFDGLKDKKPEELTPEELRWMADTMPGEGPGD